MTKLKEIPIEKIQSLLDRFHNLELVAIKLNVTRGGLWFHLSRLGYCVEKTHRITKKKKL